MKKKRWISYLLYILLGISFVICIALLCFFNFKDASPEDIKVKTENGIVAISTTREAKGFGYTFKFKGDKGEILIKSESPIIEYNKDIMDQGIEIGKKYLVSVAVNGETDAGISFYSKEVEWMAQMFLKGPEINLSENVLSWAGVENASGYEIYYTNGGDVLKVTTTETFFKLDTLKGGRSDIYVVAQSNYDYYLQSMPSNKLQSVKIVHEIPAVKMISFSKNTTVLSITVAEKIDAFTLYLDDEEYKVVDFDYNGNVITCNIDYIFSNQTKIGVKPLAVDEYNKCSSDPIYITIL